MKVRDYLYNVKSVLESVKNMGLKLDDIQYLDMFDKYIEMKKRGDKITYIAELLSAEYGIKQRTFFYLVKKFDSNI